ncbi:MAG: hypothetical protein LUD07_00810 [Clostridiales bacterium]|nr:hypothetical protein [Clostridiales bacterium]
MTREELIEELFDLRDYHTVSKKTFGFVECNGRLALPVVKEGNCLSFPLDENVEAFRYTIPVSAMISRYADRPFEASLYIRKSLIKKFKEYGCSDRKARDYIAGSCLLPDQGL